MRLEHSTTQHPDGEEETTINILLDQPGENTRPDDSTDARKTAWCFLRCEDDLDAWSKYTSFLSPFLEEEEDLLCAGGVWHPPSLADQVPPPPCLPLKQGLSLALKQIDSFLSRTSTPGSTPGQVPLSVHLVLLLPRLLPPSSPSEADGESLGTVSETSSGKDEDRLYAERAAKSITKFHPRCKVFLHAERGVDSIKDWGNEVKEAKELPLCSRDGSVLSSLTLSLPDPASLVSLSPHHPLPPMETRLRLSLSASPLVLHLPLSEAQTVSFRRKRNFALYGRKAPTGAEGVQVGENGFYRLLCPPYFYSPPGLGSGSSTHPRQGRVSPAPSSPSGNKASRMVASPDWVTRSCSLPVGRTYSLF